MPGSLNFHKRSDLKNQKNFLHFGENQTSLLPFKIPLYKVVQIAEFEVKPKNSLGLMTGHCRCFLRISERPDQKVIFYKNA